MNTLTNFYHKNNNIELHTNTLNKYPYTTNGVRPAITIPKSELN